MEKMKSRTKNILLATILTVVLTGFFYSDRPLAETIVILDGSSLIEQAKELNGQEVIYQGEVIGDIMPRQDHYWINVLGNGTAIGIWITAEQRSLINMAGQYGTLGDEVKIVGQFNQACTEHGGDLDIHAKSVEVVEKGMIIPEKLNVTRMIIAACLFITASFLLIILIKQRFHQKNAKIK